MGAFGCEIYGGIKDVGEGFQRSFHPSDACCAGHTMNFYLNFFGVGCHRAYAGGLECREERKRVACG